MEMGMRKECLVVFFDDASGKGKPHSFPNLNKYDIRQSHETIFHSKECGKLPHDGINGDQMGIKSWVARWKGKQSTKGLLIAFIFILHLSDNS